MSQVHIKHLKKELTLSYAAGSNIMLLSKPAIGKSESVEAWAAEMAKRVSGFGYWPYDLLTANPNDVCAYMPDDKTRKLAVYPSATLPNAYDDPDLKGVVFMDEIMNGDPTTVKVFQKYCNNENISGSLRKPDGVIIAMASNRIGDKAGVMQQSRAFLSRVEQQEVYSDAPHNLKFAEADGWHPVVLDFMKKFPSLIDNYDAVFEPDSQAAKSAMAVSGAKVSREDMSEEGKRGIWANMRSWKRISKLEYAATNLGIELGGHRFMSNVGKAVGIQYNTHRAMFDKMASVEEILNNPKKVDVPERADMQFVLAGMIAMLVPQEKVKEAGIFLDRLPGDIRAIAIRRMVLRSQKDKAAFDIGSTKEYHAWMRDPAVSDLFMAAR